jgi:hypothetical protein
VRGEAELIEPDLVARPLIIERETGTGMADLVEPAGELDPSGRRRARRHRIWARRLIGRQQRVDREDVLDVHQDQFLMLLFVLQAQFDEGRGLMPHRRAGLINQPQHRRADMVAIGADRIDRRARQKPAFRPWVAWPGRLVIGIEQISEGRIEHPVSRVERPEQKGLEEPTGVGEMPFCRADVGHRLDRLVLGREVGGARLGFPADRGEAVALGGTVLNRR